MNGNKTATIVFTVFFAVGLLFIAIAGIWLVNSKEFKEKAVSVEGRIVEIESYRDNDGERHYRAYVTYEYEDVLYEHVRLGSYSSTMFEGDRIELYLDPERPEKIKTGMGMWIAPIIFGAMGVVFSLVGGIGLFGAIARKNKIKKIKENGRALYGVVDEITLNHTYTVNGRHPYVIYCAYKDETTDTLYRFKSDNLWWNPENTYQPGSQIKIIVNPSDYSQYYVEAEEAAASNIVDFT